MADPKDNLIKSAELPPEERSRRARIAAKASAEARRKKKSMKNAMNLLLQQDVSQANKELLINMGIPEDETNNMMLVMVSAFKQALNGNVKAMEFIAHITGANAMSEAEKERLKIEKEKIKLEKQKLEGKKKDDELDDGVVIINDA